MGPEGVAINEIFGLVKSTFLVENTLYSILQSAQIYMNINKRGVHINKVLDK